MKFLVEVPDSLFDLIRKVLADTFACYEHEPTEEEIITELFWAECGMETFDDRDIVDVTKIK